VALAALAHLAQRTGGALDPAHDARLAALARCSAAWEALVVGLEALPPERACRLACAQLELLEHFPSPDGAEAAVRQLETRGGGPYIEPLLARVVAAIGPAARSALEAAIARDSPGRAVIAKSLARLGKVSARRSRARPAEH